MPRPSSRQGQGRASTTRRPHSSGRDDKHPLHPRAASLPGHLPIGHRVPAPVGTVKGECSGRRPDRVAGQRGLPPGSLPRERLPGVVCRQLIPASSRRGRFARRNPSILPTGRQTRHGQRGASRHGRPNSGAEKESMRRARVVHAAESPVPPVMRRSALCRAEILDTPHRRAEVVVGRPARRPRLASAVGWGWGRETVALGPGIPLSSTSSR
jgi:hypothetical protein